MLNKAEFHKYPPIYWACTVQLTNSLVMETSKKLASNKDKLANETPARHNLFLSYSIIFLIYKIIFSFSTFQKK